MSDFTHKTYAKLSPANNPNNWCVMEWDDAIDQLNELDAGEAFIFERVLMSVKDYEALPMHEGW